MFPSGRTRRYIKIIHDFKGKCQYEAILRTSHYQLRGMAVGIPWLQLWLACGWHVAAQGSSVVVCSWPSAVVDLASSRGMVDCVRLCLDLAGTGESRRLCLALTRSVDWLP